MIAKVIVDVTHSNVDKVFDYMIPENLVVEKGARVLVPFGRQNVEGFVIDISDSTDCPIEKLKSVSEVLDKIPPLTTDTIELADFVAKKYHALKSEVLRLMIPSEMRGGKVKEKEKTVVCLCGIPYAEAVGTIAKNARKQFDLLEDIYGGENDYTFLASCYGYPALKALEKKGIVYFEEEHINRIPYEFVEEKDEEHVLTEEQKGAIEYVEKTDKEITLIRGVTGSGKTEIYLNLIEKELKKGKTALFMVPEIALTPQMVSKLRARFKDTVAIIHSGLSAGERFDEWWRIRTGEAKIVVGARSAVFAPLQNIGIIVIDEEHETSYRAENSPRYSTIDVAKYRIRNSRGKIVLGSATPSVESYYKAKSGEYGLFEITERVNKRRLPYVEIVDMKREVQRGNKSLISSELEKLLKKTLDSGEQAILFLNRRGFSAYYQCLDCGYVCKCNTCDVSLNYHKSEHALKCHYCGTKYIIPKTCPECGGNHFKMGGVGTERIVEEVQKLFPEARILRMDNDTTSTKEAHNAILSTFRKHQADILVGTQMVAKGHDFPLCTLVGIIDADQSLYYSDYRSGERTFQLVTQVAGRAGRAEREGIVLLQTYSPHHYIINYATKYNYVDFYDYEINARRATLFPPFADIVRIMIISSDEAKAKKTSRAIFNQINDLKKKKEGDFVYFNGMRSPISRIDDKFRFQIICRITGEEVAKIEENIYNIVDNCKDAGVTSFVEINPANMY